MLKIGDILKYSLTFNLPMSLNNLTSLPDTLNLSK